MVQIGVVFEDFLKRKVDLLQTSYRVELVFKVEFESPI